MNWRGYNDIFEYLGDFYRLQMTTKSLSMDKMKDKEILSSSFSWKCIEICQRGLQWT